MFGLRTRRIEIDKDLEEDSIEYWEAIQDEIIGFLWVDRTELPDYPWILESEKNDN